MLTTSYRTRGVNFAFLVGPPKTLSRQDGMAIHSAICEALGVEDLSFQYSAEEGQPGGGRAFSITMARQQGRGEFKMTVDNAGSQAPVRLLIEHTWPPSREHVLEDLDLAFDAVFEAIGEGWGRVLAETRVRGQTEAGGDSAVSFLSGDILHMSRGELDRLETPLSHLAIKYETEAAASTEADPLAHPKREVSIEVLREDPRCLYLEVMSQWTQVPINVPINPVQGATIEIDARRIRTFESLPSTYVKNTEDYLQTVVLPLFDRS